MTPSDPTAVQARAARIGLVLFDVDGVLTDGGVLIHADGSESKRFNIRDGIAMVWAQRAGLTVGFLSARFSPTTAHRAAQLGITLVHQGVTDKREAYAVILRETGKADADVAYMGGRHPRSPGADARRARGRPGRRRARGARAGALGEPVAGRGRRRARAAGTGAPGAGPLGSDRRGVYGLGVARVTEYLPLLVGLIALLAGLAIGKAWERYKLRDGRWIDRRRARESPHYILGLNFLVANQIDLAIEELSRAASLDGDALEVHMILGNLYREKGQVGTRDHRASERCCSARG